MHSIMILPIFVTGTLLELDENKTIPTFDFYLKNNLSIIKYKNIYI